MSETLRPRFESGDTVSTFSELIEALYLQPKDFRILIIIPYGEHNTIWNNAEQKSRQRLNMTLKNRATLDGKPALLVEFKVL
jgi:hypothetical protein